MPMLFVCFHFKSFCILSAGISSLKVKMVAWRWGGGYWGDSVMRPYDNSGCAFSCLFAWIDRARGAPQLCCFIAVCLCGTVLAGLSRGRDVTCSWWCKKELSRQARWRRVLFVQKCDRQHGREPWDCHAENLWMRHRELLTVHDVICEWSCDTWDMQALCYKMSFTNLKVTTWYVGCCHMWLPAWHF